MKKYLAISAAIILAGAANLAAEENHGEKMDAHVKMALGDKGREDLTLINIMQDLGANMNRIAWGIFTNNRYMIEEGAKAVSDHPMPKGGLKPYLKKNADMIKDVVPEYDRMIHKTAKQMQEQARTASMPELQTMAAKITDGCISCHDLFRNP